MEISYKKNDGQLMTVLLSKDESGNPIWQLDESSNENQTKSIELLNVLTEQSLLLGETDLDHPLSGYRSPSNPNEYILIKHIIEDTLGYELVEPTINDFIDDSPEDPNILY